MNLAITGPTSGIGAETFKALTKDFDKLLILARNLDKAKDLIQSLDSNIRTKAVFVPLDLADMNSIVKSIALIEKEVEHLDVLINNAGGIFQNKEITKDGFELTFSANHLGHFLLTHHLIPLLLKSKSPKVINVSSEAHRAAKPNFNDVQYENGNYSSFNAYANAKLFNILFTKSLVDRYSSKGLSSFALHPGVVKSNFGMETSGVFKFLWKLATPFMVTPKEGAKTSIYLAKNKIDKSYNGYYFKNSKPNTPSTTARSKKMQERLWQESERLLNKWL
ncbi:NAD(P)-dependent dehydrogenase, short-chain alcohol dehydrogenase family [Aquiflexum balticum DSM 16537]|uniref:NAD(P)-dependent dehydrogenase, short-chain alcohol dehydrogenase family n=1 Tax=Aquiflexum balticum DSM 16537 TaxID=758820 RepID=A0A1W2H8N7_9BACT|nr:SDR family NAD(P)-dependent oxidoreductase [Aquiflexum balticum]SMD44966.1 NAD(P)-dependent dehydrogenase, short-chain alcohol dehydrogenase family [Aquiflexum balticum DSM 16537]